jgi:hypothetical protein
MAERVGYVLELPPGFRRFIGLAELVAPVGLILPGATGIFPGLYLARP